MSYSVCALCQSMVPCYEKYCTACLRKHRFLKQDAEFWKNWRGSFEEAIQEAKKELEAK